MKLATRRQSWVSFSESKVQFLQKDMAIMRSIVEVLKTFSLMGEAEHVEKEARSKDIDVPSPYTPLTK